MLLFEEKGFSRAQLTSLNRMRLHQQVLFLSDILGASGKSLDTRYMQLRPSEQNWYTLKFPTEKPTVKDLWLWRQALRQVAPAGGVPDRLGPFVGKGHKVWEWRHEELTGRIFHTVGDETEVFEAILPMQRRFDCVQSAEPVEIRGELCDVRWISEDKVLRRGTSDAPVPPMEPDTFHDVLDEWGNGWMWESMRVSGDGD